MPEQSTVAALILAAGLSRRMTQGHHKLLLKLGTKPVITHVVEAVLHSQVDQCIIVLGYQADQLRAALADYTASPKVHLVENPAFTQGMSTSLRSGLATLQASDKQTGAQQHISTSDCALIVLGDQPFISPSILDALIACRQQTQQRIIVPYYHGQRGTPVLFAASLFPELAQVQGDEGGKSVIERHPTEVVALEMADTLANKQAQMAQYDIDTWTAYQQALAQWQNSTNG
jgi:Uncharacterized MobA-related protein